MEIGAPRPYKVLGGCEYSSRPRPSARTRWRSVKRHIVHIEDGLGLARIERESAAPAIEEQVRKALDHVRCGLGEDGKRLNLGTTRSHSGVATF